MGERQLLLLFLCKLIIYSVGFGIHSLLSVYAKQLGASPEFIGYFLSTAAFCLCSGTLVAGWLLKQWKSYRFLFCTTAIAYSIGLFLMSQIHNVWQLVIFTAIVWFLGGIGLSLISILAGWLSRVDDRGKVFSWLEITQGLGGLVGGLIVSWSVNWLGYSGMFLTVTGFSLIWLGSGLLLQEPSIKNQETSSHALLQFEKQEPKKDVFNFGFYGLLLSSIVFTLIQSIDALTRQLLMNHLQFNVTAIASIASTGAVSLPFLPIIGWICDRIRQKRWILIGCCLVGAVGMLATASATTFWQFWFTAALINASHPIFIAVGITLTTYLVPPSSLGVALSLFNATLFLPGVFGYFITGHLIRQLGMVDTFALSAFLPLMACLFLIPLSRGKNRLKF